MTGEHPNTREALTTERRSMDPELKAKWLEALRGGKYIQGSGQLCADDGSFCCLGVLCDIADSNAWDDDAWFHGEGEDRDSEVGTLPSAFRIKVGISDAAETELIRMNDSGDRSFADIADYIEKNL